MKVKVYATSRLPNNFALELLIHTRTQHYVLGMRLHSMKPNVFHDARVLLGVEGHAQGFLRIKQGALQ